MHKYSPASGDGALLAHRDAMIICLQYGLASRNQELWGLRWSALHGDFVWVSEVLSYGQLEPWGKTARSTQRRTAMPSLLREDLERWRELLTNSGRSAREVDFIIPGNLTGASYGIREAETGACHLSRSQAKGWGRAASRQRYEQSPSAQSSRASSAPPPTPYAAAVSRYACAPRTHKPSPASAAPASRCSATTTPSRSRICASTSRVPPTFSGARRVPH